MLLNKSIRHLNKSIRHLNKCRREIYKNKYQVQRRGSLLGYKVSPLEKKSNHFDELQVE